MIARTVRTICWCALAVALAAGILLALVLSPTLVGDGLRDRIGGQLLRIVNSHTVPQFAFETLDYTAPTTVTLGNATMTAPDGFRIIEVGTLEVTLSEQPIEGEPLHIARIRAVDGVVRLQIAEGGGLRGFEPFVKPSLAEGEDELADDEKFSETLELEKIVLENIDLEYSSGPDQPPMQLDDIQIDWDIARTPEPGEDGAPGGDGWYAIDLEAGREPGSEIALDGRINLDDNTAWVRSLAWSLALDSDAVASLPSSLQEFATTRGLAGRATFNASGTFPLTDPLSGSLDGSLEVEGLTADVGGTPLAVKMFRSTAVTEAGDLVLKTISMGAFSGSINGDGRLGFRTESQRGNLSLILKDLDLGEIRALAASSRESGRSSGGVQGKLSGSVRTSFALDDPRRSLGGDAELRIREGRLLQLPIISSLAEAMDIGLQRDGNTTSDHTADITAQLTPSAAVITKGNVVTNVLAARGTGPIEWTGALDLSVNAGPLERLQEGLGVIGDLFGKLTDSLLKYRVRGTVEDPKVSVTPLGVSG
ncbi:MAG: AsmA-like C-terminal region-containing protein [Planctomycetota bacterium]